MDLCPIGHTSCYNSGDNTAQGCCQGDNAVCCKDMLHCCPENFACSDTRKRCMQLEQDSPSNNAKKVHSPRDVVCPDGKSRCPDFTTCCLLPPGGYGCCNYTEARCCSDKTHCCPKGFDCAEGTDKCKRGDTFILAHILNSRKANQCEDNKTVCTNNTTCCKQPNDSYGCCPADNTVCCGAYCCSSDLPTCCGMYCCKEDPGCDRVAMKCKEEKEVPYTNMKQMYTIESIKLIKFQETKKVDFVGLERSKCNLVQRSCDQGCCPDGKGICCSNQNYCCPQKFTCTSDGMCAMLKY